VDPVARVRNYISEIPRSATDDKIEATHRPFINKNSAGCFTPPRLTTLHQAPSIAFPLFNTNRGSRWGWVETRTQVERGSLKTN